jgi:hypothetical protein
MEIFKRIPKIAGEIEAIGKDQRAQGSGHGFNFRGIDDVYNAVSKVMAKHGVFSVPEIIDANFIDVSSRQGTKGIHARIKYKFTFYAEDGSSVSAMTFGEGIDYGDKASNKCASIAHKYALLQIFAIPTADNDDPDKEIHEIKSDKPTEKRTEPQKNEKQKRAATDGDIKKLWALAKAKGYDGIHIDVAANAFFKKGPRGLTKEELKVLESMISKYEAEELMTRAKEKVEGE